MMSHATIIRRINRLEELADPNNRVWNARSQEILRFLDERPVLTTVLLYASRKAYRRLQAGSPSLTDDGRRIGWTPYFDHFEDVDHDQLVMLACREAWRLVDIAKDMPFVDATTTWLDEADEEGWPALEGRPMTSDAFWRDVRAEWRSLNAKRQMRSPEAAEWRRRNPSWRPDLSENERVTFDVGETRNS